MSHDAGSKAEDLTMVDRADRDLARFLGLRRVDEHRFELTVRPELLASGDFLYGGCGMAATLIAAETVTGRPLVWATGQFRSFARDGEIVTIHVDEVVSGHQLSQTQVSAGVGERSVIGLIGAHGLRDFDRSGQYEAMPVVPDPDQCPPRESMPWTMKTIAERLEVKAVEWRLIAERDASRGSGVVRTWTRLIDLPEVTASSLAIMADCVPTAVGQGLGIVGGGTSLDNTIRIVRLVPTDWVLVDCRLEAVANGFGHGRVLLWAQDGTLLAVASQSCVARYWSKPAKGNRPIHVPDALPEARGIATSPPDALRTAEEQR